MVTRSRPRWQSPAYAPGLSGVGPAPDAWRRALTGAFRDPAALLRWLDLDPALAAGSAAPSGAFPMLVPRGFAALMQPGNPADPLLRQVLPVALEAVAVPGFALDPVGDGAACRAPGLLQKYAGRALLLTTGACAVHCRYCFRRHWSYGEGSTLADGAGAALAAIAADPTISEVILSGGDPLLLPDAQLAALFGQLGRIRQVRRLRLHTRVPVVLPERITPALVALLAAVPRPLVVVIHANHPAELGAGAGAGVAALGATGAVLLNQSVLLAGVNDDAETLVALAERLFSMGVGNYYLHMLDAVQGAAHFYVPEAAAVALVAAMRARLSGYLVPRLVREVPGAPGKLPVG